MLQPSSDYIKTYFYVVFGYSEGFIPLRSFAEKGNNNSRPPSNMWIKADDEVVEHAANFAKLANQRSSAFYVVPGTVSKAGVAGSIDVIQMQTLLIDIDVGDTESKLTNLTAALGEPTMVVESGGITDSGHAKLHIYWQLTKAVTGDDLQKLLKLRYQIALVFGADTHFKSAHQPIRVAGSIYHKGGKHHLVKIRSYNPVEYEIEELITRASYLPTLNNNIAVNALKPSNNNTLPFNSLLTNKVHEGGNGEHTRFNHLSRVIGYWLRRCHDGLISKDEAIEEIHSYNLSNVIPSWSLEKIKQTVNGLWKLHLQKYGEPKKVNCKENSKLPIIKSFSFESLLGDKSSLPEDLIAPRILTLGGMLVFGGSPKVGKSDFLLSLLVHMAAGREFIGFVPPRPLRIFYFQAEIGYHYLRERLQNMQLSEEIINLAKDNLYITPNSKLSLDEKTIEALAEHIKQVFSDKLDIIAIDPIRNVFDGGRNGATENDNDAMLFFLQKRIELLRDQVNLDAGIILVHHTKKITKTQFDEDPFQAFSGASSLRGYYTAGTLLYKPDLESNDRHLIFELRNGREIPTKIICKKDGRWVEESIANNKRIAFKKSGLLFDRERQRRVMVILNLLESEAIKGKFYLMKQFGEKFRNTNDLGNKRAICDDCSAAATKGLIKFFDNPKDYGLKLVKEGKANFGFMCTEGMRMYLGESIDANTGEISKNYKAILPTHYKRDGDGKKDDVLNPKIWHIDLEESMRIK
ncbi:AAA family ATPase [Candidatus Tisiphia endosymbiont of Temnostethus pusillus]|uniref:AAA family ATPase n=1 Tax=Candidatus Tisiphia endosymbiont of Temnostethus pusillus TaxID=3139335 RepID=UPI0035C91B18